MIKSEHKIEMNVSPETLFNRLTNPMNALEDVPNVIEVRDITGQGLGMTYKLIYKMMGMKLTMDCEFIEYELNKHVVISLGNALKGTQRWAFKAVDNGCEFTSELEYSLPIPFVGKIAEPLLKKNNEREWDTILANLKDLLEAEVDVAVK